MLTLQPIDHICDSIASIRDIYIADPSLLTESVANSTDPLPSNFYKISYRDFSAQYQEEQQRGDGGAYAVQTLQFFLPYRRAAVQHLIQHSVHRKISAIAYNRYGQRYILESSRFSYRYTNGKRPGENEGYEITITAIDLLRSSYVVQETEIAPTGLVGTIPGDNTIFTIVPTLGGTPVSAFDCCITIQSPSVAVAPAATGNTNKNKIVTTTSGDIYFIDKDGTSIRLNTGGTVPRQIISSTPATLTASITSTDQIIVFRNGVLMDHVATPTRSEHYNLNLTTMQFTLAPDWTLEGADKIEVIKL